MSMGARVGLTWAALMMLGLASLWLNSRGPGAGVAFAAVIGVAAVKAFLVAWFAPPIPCYPFHAYEGHGA